MDYKFRAKIEVVGPNNKTIKIDWDLNYWPDLPDKLRKELGERIEGELGLEVNNH